MQRLMHIVRRKLTLYVTFAPEVPSASQWARLSPNSASCSTCKRSMACWNGGYHASSRFAGMRSARHGPGAAIQQAVHTVGAKIPAQHPLTSAGAADELLLLEKVQQFLPLILGQQPTRTMQVGQA